MDKTSLVSVDIERGADVLSALDGVGLRLSVALWLYALEYGDWRLVVSSPRFDKVDPRQAYLLLNRSLREAGIPVEQLPQFWILPMSDPFIKQLRSMFAKAANVNGMRLGGQSIGGRFVEDAWVYRIS